MVWGTSCSQRLHGLVDQRMQRKTSHSKCSRIRTRLFPTETTPYVLPQWCVRTMLDALNCSRQLRNCFQCVYSLQLAHFHAIDVLATTSHYFQMHTHAHREPHPPVVLVVDSHNIRLNMTKLACKLQAGLFRSAACSLRSVCC